MNHFLSRLVILLTCFNIITSAVAGPALNDSGAPRPQTEKFKCYITPDPDSLFIDTFGDKKVTLDTGYCLRASFITGFDIENFINYFAKVPSKKWPGSAAPDEVYADLIKSDLGNNDEKLSICTINEVRYHVVRLSKDSCKGAVVPSDLRWSRR